MNLIEVTTMRDDHHTQKQVALLLTWRSPRYRSSRWCFWEDHSKTFIVMYITHLSSIRTTPCCTLSSGRQLLISQWNPPCVGVVRPCLTVRCRWSGSFAAAGAVWSVCCLDTDRSSSYSVVSPLLVWPKLLHIVLMKLYHIKRILAGKIFNNNFDLYRDLRCLCVAV